MNQRSDIDRLLRHWMDDGPTRMPDRIVDVVADRISAQRQRRSWRLVRRLLMNPLLKLGAAAAAVLVIALVGWNLMPRDPSIGGPSPAKSPTLTPSPTPGSTPMALHEGQLLAGRYLVQPFSDLPSLTFTADFPAGWGGLTPVGAIGPRGSEGPDGIAFGTLRVDGLFSDPCQWDLDGTGNPEQPGDVKIGPGTVDLVQGLQANTAYESSENSWADFPQPEQGLGETVGFSMEVRLPASLDIAACDRDIGGDSRYYVFSGPYAGLYAQGDGNIWELAMVELSGTRLIAVLSYFESTPPADLAAGEAILRSLDFKP
jgi:hypothetical protein